VYFNRQYRIAIWTVSLLVAIVLFTLIFLYGIYVPSEPYLIPINHRVNNALVMGLVISLASPAIIEFNNSRWLRGVEDNIPRLLRDVTEAVTSGVPLVEALEDASTGDYGPVSKPLEAAMVKFSLTSDFEWALTWLGEKLKRPAAKRMCSILIEAYESGGKIIDILGSSVELFTSLAEYREEKASNMRPYIFVVYLGVFVFLTISCVVLVQFLGPLAVAAMNPQEGQAALLHNVLDMDYYKSILFWAAVIEALTGGIVAGRMSGGRIKAGLVHSVLLLLTVLAFFNSFRV
jgi:flagellar protein FlaJ